MFIFKTESVFGIVFPIFIYCNLQAPPQKKKKKKKKKKKTTTKNKKSNNKKTVDYITPNSLSTI